MSRAPGSESCSLQATGRKTEQMGQAEGHCMGDGRRGAQGDRGEAHGGDKDNAQEAGSQLLGCQVSSPQGQARVPKRLGRGHTTDHPECGPGSAGSGKSRGSGLLVDLH